MRRKFASNYTYCRRLLPVFWLLAVSRLVELIQTRSWLASVGLYECICRTWVAGRLSQNGGYVPPRFLSLEHEEYRRSLISARVPTPPDAVSCPLFFLLFLAFGRLHSAMLNQEALQIIVIGIAKRGSAPVVAGVGISTCFK
jgi:hypothetical protein